MTMTLHLSGLAAVVVLGLAWSLSAASVPERRPPTAEDIARARKVVEADPRLRGSGAVVTPIEDDAVGRSLPEYVFVAVLFRQFPVARVPPAGLRASNVFAVDRSGKVAVLTDAAGLEKFFRAHLAPTTDDDRLKDVAAVWMRLSEEFHQDGFFTFKLLDATKVDSSGTNKTASATAGVMRGGSGFLKATLTFDKAGKLTKVEEENRLRKGPRPICQATKLLDLDPVVRRMAEQDLLIMGTAAKPYLDEQRSRASPQLRRAIDRLWRRIEQDDRE
jgi:hypothetical protein